MTGCRDCLVDWGWSGWRDVAFRLGGEGESFLDAV